MGAGHGAWKEPEGENAHVGWGLSWSTALHKLSPVEQGCEEHGDALPVPGTCCVCVAWQQTARGVAPPRL